MFLHVSQHPSRAMNTLTVAAAIMSTTICPAIHCKLTDRPVQYSEKPANLAGHNSCTLPFHVIILAFPVWRMISRTSFRHPT
jgi:hypothetical protein